MKNFPRIFEKDDMMLPTLTYQIKTNKQMLEKPYTNWSISGKPESTSSQEVKTSNEQSASAIKLDFDSQYRLLKFLIRVV